MYPYAYKKPSVQREFELADKAEKTKAIKESRDALVALEAVIEALVNLDPPRFEPFEVSHLRDRFKSLTVSMERAVDMLGEERDEMAAVSDRIYFLESRIEDLSKARDTAQENTTKYYAEAVEAKRELHRLRMQEVDDDGGPDCG